MNRPLVLALAASFALGSTAAGADPVVDVELSNFQFRLVDLDLTDGITPSIDLSGFGGAAASVRWRSSATGTSVFGPVLATGSGPNGESEQVSITGNLTQGGTALVLNTLGDVPGDYRTAISELRIGDAPAGGAALFTLSPHTELVMSGTVTITASTSLRLPGEPDENAFGEVTVALGGDADEFRAHAWNKDPGYGDRSTSDDFSLSFIDATDAAMQGGFGIDLWALAAVDPPPTPVPEPGAAPLMLAALAGMVLVARGRRRSS